MNTFTSADNNKSNKKMDYLFIFLLLAFSGNPLVGFLGGQYVYIFFLITSFLLYIFNKGMVTFSHTLTSWIFASILLFIAQAVVLDQVSIPADINFLLRLVASYICVSFLGVRFRYVYLRVITFLALVSLFFFTIQFLFNVVAGISIPTFKSIFIYNTLIHFSSYLMRNCGMFWEPGAFQGYLMLVPVLFIDSLKVLWKDEKKSCLILLVTLLTTQSTTGYVTLFFILSCSLLKELKGFFTKALLIVLFAIGGFYTFISFDFIGEKMLEQFENAQEIQAGDVSWTRMGAMQIDRMNIERHPIIGNGFLMDAMYGKLIGSQMAGSGNGFTGALNSLGIPFILFYLIGIFRSSSGINPYQRLTAVFTIVLLLNGEFFLNYPLFWSLLFLPSDPR